MYRCGTTCRAWKLPLVNLQQHCRLHAYTNSTQNFVFSSLFGVVLFTFFFFHVVLRSRTQYIQTQGTAQLPCVWRQCVSRTWMWTLNKKLKIYFGKRLSLIFERTHIYHKRNTCTRQQMMFPENLCLSFFGKRKVLTVYNVHVHANRLKSFRQKSCLDMCLWTYKIK